MTLRDLLAAAIPGPWRVSLTDDTVVIGPDRAEVAAIDGDYNEPDLWPIMEANARLIALAPQLAEALIEARPVVEKAPCECVETFGAKGPHIVVCERCKVIARIDAIMEGRDYG